MPQVPVTKCRLLAWGNFALSSVSLICVPPSSLHTQSTSPAQPALSGRSHKKGSPLSTSTSRTQEQEHPCLEQAPVSEGCRAAVWTASQPQRQTSSTERLAGTSRAEPDRQTPETGLRGGGDFAGNTGHFSRRERSERRCGFLACVGDRALVQLQ